jgi:aspartate aminotransferase
MRLTNRLADALKPSETLAVKARAAELKAQGRKVIDLSAGEPDIDTPDHIKQAAVAALKEGKTKYTAAAGILELRRALSAKLARENALEIPPGQIVVTNGGKQALHEFFEVTLSPGDEVIIPAPYWVSYPAMVEIAGGVPVTIPTKAQNGYRLSPQELKRNLSPKTRCLVLNSPSNPTGAGYSASDLAELGEVLQESQVLVVSDEVYEKIVFSGFSFRSFAAACPALAARTVTVGAFSKTYSMTGWRVGYAAGPKEIIEAIVKFQGQTTSNINSIAQYAALAALEGSQDCLAGMVENYDRRLTLALEGLKECPGLEVPVRPVGAFYLFVRFDAMVSRLEGAGIRGSAQLCNHLLDQAGVAAVPGEAFGDNQAFRISVAASDENVKAGVKLICEALSKIG